MVQPIPEGCHTITPHLVVKRGNDAIEFYKQAFGAEELVRMPGPGGELMHAELRIGDSIFFMAGEHPDMGVLGPQSIGGTPVIINLYVADVDALFARAVAAGATAAMPPQDMFWGDRYGKVIDPFGHAWSIATHQEDLTGEEIAARAAAAFAGDGECAGQPAAAQPTGGSS